MELKSAKIVTAEDRELLPPGVAPVQRYTPCVKCSKPVDLLLGPSASVAAWTEGEDGKPSWSQFTAQHPNCEAIE